jgi:cytochrome c553
MKPLPIVPLALIAAVFWLAAPSRAAEQTAPSKPDTAKGQVISSQVCGACHTADGTRGAPANPIIAGQHADYIVKQLTEFKSGRRNNPVMKGFATLLSDIDMKNVAAFYAGAPFKPGSAKNKELVRLGEKIYRGGISDRAVPACAGCHSPNGAGIPAQYPRVGGQHADYTEAQLIAFRGGQRVNSAQMAAIASRMSDSEIKAVADYMAGLR